MNSQNQDTRGRGKNKRKWKYNEDAKLVEALLDMVNLGAYKAKNRFKKGYLKYVEKKLEVFLPNSGVKAKPHIESRIKTLKKDFNVIYGMLNGSNSSGFGIDPIKKCIIAEDPVWNSYLQSHPTHSIWQNRNFPFYDELLIVFGKDRATRGNAKGPVDMMEEIHKEIHKNDDINNVEATTKAGLEDFADSLSPLQSPRNDPIHKQKKLQRNSTMIANIKEAASIIGNEIATASQVLCKSIGVNAEISKKRQKIDSEIRKIPNLTTSEVIRVVCHIAKSPELIDVFFSMTGESRKDLVRAVLNGDV